MFEEKEINLKIDTKELEEKIMETIANRIVDIIKDYLDGNYEGAKGYRYDFKDKIIVIFRRALKQLIDENSKEIRKEVKEEVIDRAVDKLMLDKKEVLRGLLK